MSIIDRLFDLASVCRADARECECGSYFFFCSLDAAEECESLAESISSVEREIDKAEKHCQFTLAGELCIELDELTNKALALLA